MKVARNVWDVGGTASTTQKNKISSGVRTLEEIKSEMAQQEQSIKDMQERIEDYDNGWADDSSDNSRKRAHMEQRLQNLQEEHAKLKAEYENHPDYYADKYSDVGGVRKAVTGIVGSTIATVPVVAETASAAINEAERKLESDEYTSALQAEEIAWNKLNDYAASYFGSFDMIDQSELDRLSKEYEQASEYRKSLEPQYEQPVDMDSWGMDLMQESAWLKDSATENLNGFWKPVADTAVDIGQNVALTPLLLGGVGAYTAGVAANAAAEDMYTQTAKGKKASRALGSGLLTAGLETAKGKIADLDIASIKIPDIEIANIKIPVSKMLAAMETAGSESQRNFMKNVGLPATKEAINYFLDFLVDKAGRDPNAEFSLLEFVSNVAMGGIAGGFKSKTKELFEEIDQVWENFGS